MATLRRIGKFLANLFKIKGTPRNMDGSTDLYFPEDHLGI